VRGGRKLLERKLVRERRLGEILLEERLIAEDQLTNALEEQAATGGILTEILVSAGFISEWDLAKCLATRLQLPFIYTTRYEIPREAIDLLPHTLLHQHRLVPIDIFGKVLAIASAGNMSQEILEEIETSTGLEVTLYVALASDLQETLRERFPLEKVTDALSQKFDQLFQES
jgi:hypothetical protein